MTDLRPGEQLDHFRIEALAARSGMASIFRAIDLNTGRPVAIKIPHPEMECDPVFFDRFQREAQIGRELAHPGVMKVMPDYSTGRVYMVMEWLEGRLLREILTAERKLPPQRAVRIALVICDALAYIHSHGVVHRDLKPENIMVDAEDGVKLIDFGIAAKAGARRLTLGKSSELMGTAEYISPEQVSGKRGDARSDIYALGVILYEMLTGRAPFQGANPLAIMNDRLRNHPVPLREIDPRISPELQEVVCRALERTPAKRYSKAADLAWDLENPGQVPLADLAQRSPWIGPPEPLSKRIAFYGALAAIPALIFSLLIYVARQG